MEKSIFSLWCCMFEKNGQVFYLAVVKFKNRIEKTQLENNEKYDALRDLVPFVQFQKCGKHPWRIVTISKVAGVSLQLY